MAACLDSLRALRYPATEVVVVDDGSTDRTGAIADRYEGFHVIHQENKGLSAARNVGMAASTGEIIAYTDSDCVVDPDWLHYLVATFLSSGLRAVGGPNLPPPEDSFVASCVAASPGGPLEVLLDDEEAEHIPGCNMAFRREALEEIGGFDPVYRAAGDDVDVCWRLQNLGYRIGWSPAAMVWHFRRNTVKAYIGQQRGYGKAEALLYFRHPHQFNALGYARWRGRIYAGVSSILSLARPVVYGGVYGRGLFQTLYQPPSSLPAPDVHTRWNAVAGLLTMHRARRHAVSALPLTLRGRHAGPRFAPVAQRCGLSARAHRFLTTSASLACLERHEVGARVSGGAGKGLGVRAVPVSGGSGIFSCSDGHVLEKSRYRGLGKCGAQVRRSGARVETWDPRCRGDSVAGRVSGHRVSGGERGSSESDGLRACSGLDNSQSHPAASSARASPAGAFSWGTTSCSPPRSRVRLELGRMLTADPDSRRG